MLVIKVPIVRVSCGITPNITNAITPTTNTIVRIKLIGLFNFLTILFFFFTFSKIFFSKKLIGTLVRNAIAPPSTNGNIISHIVFSTPSTTSNFHKATTRSAVNTMSSRIFLIDILLRSIIFPPSDKKRNLYCMTKHAIKVSPVPCSAGCLHRTDGTANVYFKTQVTPLY